MTSLPKFRRELARVAGVKLCEEYEATLIEVSFRNWLPDKTIGQAMRCLECTIEGQMGNVFIRRNDGPLSADWGVIIDYEEIDGKATAGKLSEAICLAVIAALDLKGE